MAVYPRKQLKCTSLCCTSATEMTTGNSQCSGILFSYANFKVLDLHLYNLPTGTSMFKNKKKNLEYDIRFIRNKCIIIIPSFQTGSDLQNADQDQTTPRSVFTVRYSICILEKN